MIKTDYLKQWEAVLSAETVERCQRLLKKIEEERKQGAVIYPAQENILNAVKAVAPEQVKCVIIGQDPYHEPGQAMGLSFSVPQGQKLPPSLRNIFKELNADIGCDLPQSGDLSPWTEQGVLLLNTILTVEAHKALSHKRFGWQSITTDILRSTLLQPQPVVYICWGKQAEGVMDNLINFLTIDKPYLVIRSTHPSPLSANNHKSDVPAFTGSKPFSKVNAFLTDNNRTAVDWSL